MNLKCPKCSGEMEKITCEFSDGYIIIKKDNEEIEKIAQSTTNIDENINSISVEIDRCNSCHGMWFDKGERELLKNIDGALDIDKDIEITHTIENQDYQCPRCNIKLKEIKEEEENLILEKCDKCEGIFLDSGELKNINDTQKSSFLSKIMSLIKTS